MRMDEPTVAIRIYAGDVIRLWLTKTDDDSPEWIDVELSLDKARELRRLLTRELRHAAKSKDNGEEANNG